MAAVVVSFSERVHLFTGENTNQFLTVSGQGEVGHSSLDMDEGTIKLVKKVIQSAAMNHFRKKPDISMDQLAAEIPEISKECAAQLTAQGFEVQSLIVNSIAPDEESNAQLKQQLQAVIAETMISNDISPNSTEAQLRAMGVGPMQGLSQPSNYPKFCPGCGTPTKGENFCEVCGNKLR